MASREKETACRCSSRWTDSQPKNTPTTASSTPMMMAAMFSARAWPKGWRSSGGLAVIQKPTITTREVRLSERVCQASATIDTEPVRPPAQNLTPNRRVFRRMDSQPSR
jgi:hypothetical protein